MHKVNWIFLTLLTSNIVQYYTQEWKTLTYRVYKSDHPDGKSGYDNNLCCASRFDNPNGACNQACVLIYNMLYYQNPPADFLEQRVTLGSPGEERFSITYDPPVLLSSRVSIQSSSTAYLLLTSRNTDLSVDSGLVYSIDNTAVYSAEDAIFHFHKLAMTVDFIVDNDDRFKLYSLLSIWLRTFVVGPSVVNPEVCAFDRDNKCFSFVQLKIGQSVFYTSEPLRLFRNSADKYELHLTTTDDGAFQTFDEISLDFAYSTTISEQEGVYDSIKIQNHSLNSDATTDEFTVSSESGEITVNYRLTYQCVGNNGWKCRESFVPNDRSYYDEEENRIKCKCGNYNPPECIEKSDDDLAYCQNDGDCIIDGTDLLCLCKGSSTGSRCQIFRKPNNCLFGVENLDSSCTCNDGWTGFYCDIQTCSNDNFCNSGTCIVVDEQKKCICEPKTSFGRNCENVCNPSCVAGTCVSGLSGPVCKCEEGITGTRCDTVISQNARFDRNYQIRRLMIGLLLLINLILILAIIMLLLIAFIQYKKRKNIRESLISTTSNRLVDEMSKTINATIAPTLKS